MTASPLSFAGRDRTGPGSITSLVRSAEMTARHRSQVTSVLTTFDPPALDRTIQRNGFHGSLWPPGEAGMPLANPHRGEFGRDWGELEHTRKTNPGHQTPRDEFVNGISSGTGNRRKAPKSRSAR
jgi:hypothetical protein